MAQTTVKRGPSQGAARIGRGQQPFGQNDVTTMETYKVLSSGSVGYTPGDFELMEEILGDAEAAAHEEQLLGTGPGEMCLSRVLKSYNKVLRENSIIPEEDTHFYCLLLKLSLDPNPDWKEKLYNERLTRLPMPLERPSPAPAQEGNTPDSVIPTMPTAPEQVRVKVPIKRVIKHPDDPSPSTNNFDVQGPGISAPEPLLSKQKDRRLSGQFTEGSQMHEGDVALISLEGGTLQHSESAGRATINSSESADESAAAGPRSAPLVGIVDAEDEAAYAVYRFKALAFRRWWNHANVARSSRFYIELWAQARMAYHAMRHWRGQTIECFFHSWWKCVLEKRQACKAAAEHCFQYRRRAVLRVWGNVSKRTLFLLDCGEMIETTRHRNATQKAWVKWRARYSIQAWHRAVLTAATTKLFQTTLNRAFLGWKEKTKYEAEVKSKLQGIVKKWAQLSVAKALCRWHDYALQSARWKENVRVCLAKMRNRQLHEAFSCWAWHVEARASEKHKLEAFVNRVSKMSMVRSWNTWKEFARQSKAEKALQQRAISFMTKRALAAAFATWRENISCDVEFRDKMERVLKRMRNLSMGRAFVAWQQWAEYKRAEQEMLQACVAQIAKNVGARALRQWKVQAMESARLKDLMKAVVHRINNISMAYAFEGWRDRVELKRHQRDAIAQSLDTLANGLVSRAFRTWNERAELRKQRQKIHDKISLKHKSRIRAEQLRCWRVQCENKRKVRSVIALMQNRQVTLSLRFWMEWARQARRVRDVGHKCVLALIHRRKWAVFQRWQEITIDRLEKKSKIAASLVHIRKGTLSKAFASWVEFTDGSIQEREILQKAVATFMKITERRAWNSWLSVVQKRQTKGEQLFNAIILWEKVALSKAWRTWVEYHDHKQANKGRMRTAAACLRKFSQAKAFNSWKEFMDYQFVKNDAIEDACICYEDHLLMASMNGFKMAVERHHKLQAAAREFLTGVITGSLRAVFQEWRNRVHHQKQKKQDLLWVLGHFEKQRLTQSFYRWRIQAEQSLLEKDKEGFAFKHSLLQLKKMVLKEWSDWAKYKQYCKTSVVDRLQAKRRSILTIGLGALRENVLWVKKIRAAVYHWQCSSAIRALQLWKAYVDSMRCLEASLEGVLRRWRWGIVVAVYEEWKGLASYKTFKKQQILSAWQHYHSHRLGGLFQFWKKWASNQITKRQNQIVARNHFVGSTLSGCFDCWVKFAIESVELRYKLEKATVFWANREMAVTFEAWRENAREIADTRTCLQFFKESTSIKAFDTWVWFTIHQQEKRAKLSEAVALWGGKTLGTTFQSWQELTQEKKQRKAKAKWVVMKLANAKALTVLNTWMDWAKQHKEFKQKTAWVVYRIQCREVSLTFNAWVDFVDYQKERRDKICKATKFWLNQTIGSVFNHWLDQAQTRKDTRRKLAWVMARLRNRILVAAFMAWSDWAGEQRENGKKMAIAAASIHNRLCRSAFRSWVAHMRYKAKKACLLSRAVKLISNHEKGMAFQSWQAWLQYKQEKRAMLMNAVTAIQSIQMCAAFAAWSDWMRCKKEKQSKLQRIARVLLNSKLAAALRAWKGWVGWKRNHQNVMTTIAVRLIQRTLAKGFYSWIDGVDYQRDMRVKAEMAVTLMLHRVVGSAFREWRENVVEARLDRVLMERALMFFRNSQLMYAFQGWKEWLVTHMEKKSKMQTVMVRWSQSTLSWAFTAWVDWAKPHRTMRCKLEWAARKIRNKGLNEAFNTWVAFTIENKIVRITCNRMMSRTLAAAFSAWADRTCFLREQSEKLKWAVQKLKNVAMSKALATLVWYARSKQEERRILSRALQKLSLRHQCMAFRAWVDWWQRRQQSRAKLASAVSKLTKRAMLEGFNAWKGLYLERCEWRAIVEKSWLKLANRALTSAFGTWRGHATMRKLQQAKLARAVAVMGERSLQCAFNTWHGWVEDRIVCRWAVKRIQEGVVHRAFFCWMAHAEKRAANRDKVAACVKKLSNKVLLLAFNEWVYWAAMKSVQRSATNAADQQYAQACMQNVLQAWHQSVCKEKKAITYWINLRAAKAFQSWCDFVLAERSKRMAIQKALQHWRAHLLADSFDSWKYHVAQKFRSKSAMEFAARHWTKRSLVAAFNTWREVRATKKSKKEAIIVAVCHWSQGAVVSAFYTWRDQILQLRRLKQLVLLIKNRHLAAAFTSWQTATAYWKDKAATTCAAVTMCQSFAMMKSFECWKHHHRCQTLKQRNVARALHFWQSHVVATALQSWKECMELHREQLGCVHWMVGRQNLRNVSAGFFGFRMNVERRRKTRHAIWQWQKGCVRRHFVLWKGNVANCQAEADNMEWAAAYCLKAMLATAFNTWSASTQESSKIKLALEFWSVGQLAEAFISWKLCVAEKQQKRESLRVALTHWSGQLLAGAFFCWKSFAGDSLQERRQTLQAIHHWQTLSTAEAFKAWVVFVEWNQSSRLLSQACKRRFAERRTVSCFHAWRERSVENKAVRTKLETVLILTAHRKLDVALQVWKGYAKWRSTCRSAANMIMTKAELRATLSAWNSWVDYVNVRRMKADATNQYATVLMSKGFLGFQYTVHLGRAVDAGQDRINHRLRVDAWRSWLGLTRCRKEQNATVETFFNHRSARRATETKVLFFFSWHHMVQAWKQGTALLVRIRHREIAAALLAWLDHTRISIASRELLLKTLWGVKRAVLREWRVAALYLRDERERLDRMALVIAESEAPAAGFARYSLYRWKNLLLSQALECWIELKAEHEKDRMNSIAAYQHLYFKLAKKTFDAFKEEVEHGWKFRFADMYRKHNVIRTATVAWQHLAKGNRTLRLAGKNVYLAHTTSVLRRALLALQENVFHQSTKRMQEKTACQYMERYRLSVFFEEWRDHYAAFRNIQEAFDILVVKAQRKQLIGGFQLWKYGAAWSKRLKASKIVSIHFYETSITSKVFRGWRDTVNWGLYSKSVLQEMAAKRQVNLARNAFCCWREVTHRNTDLLVRLQMGLANHRASTLDNIFSVWRYTASNQVQERTNEAKAARFAAFRLQFGVLLSWNTYASRKSALRRAAMELMQRLAKRKVASAFASWKGNTEQAMHTRVRAGEIAKIVLKSQLSRFLIEWKIVAARRVHLKGGLSLFLERWKIKHLETLFEAWQSWSRWKVKKRRGLLFFNSKSLIKALVSWKVYLKMTKWERAVDFNQRSAASSAFTAWSEVAAGRRQARRLNRLVIALRFRTLAMKGLRGWWWVTASGKDRKARGHLIRVKANTRRVVGALTHWRQTHKACRHARQSLLSTAFQAWLEQRDYIHNKMMVDREAADVFNRKLVTRALDAWRSEVQHMQLKQMVFARRQAAVREAVRIGDEIAQKRQKELTESVFRSWWQFVVLRKNWRWLLDRVQRRCRREAWDDWRNFIDDKHVKVAQTLRACSHFESRCLRHGLRTWHKSAKISAVDARHKAALADNFFLQKKIAIIMHGWLQEVHLRRSQRAALRSAFTVILESENEQRVGDCWQLWQCWVKIAREQHRKLNLLIARNVRRRVQDVFTLWANYTSAMKRDLDPSSPFLSPEASQYAQKSIRRLSSMVQKSIETSRKPQLDTSSTSQSDETYSRGEDQVSGESAEYPGMKSPRDARGLARHDHSNCLELEEDGRSSLLVLKNFPRRSLVEKKGSDGFREQSTSPREKRISSVRWSPRSSLADAGEAFPPVDRPSVTEQRLSKLGTELQDLRKRLDSDLRKQSR